MSGVTGTLVIFLLPFLAAIPFGMYISKVYKGERTWLDFLRPLENLIFRISGIDPEKEMTWKQHLAALLTINAVWLVYAFGMLITQTIHFWNPDHNPSMSLHLAFNTAVSFVVNCNLQDYSGETGASYLSQTAVFTFLQFVSAATGMAAAVVIFNAFREKTTDKLGNFFNYFLKSITRILLPVAIIIAVVLVFKGIPQTFRGNETVKTLQGNIMQVSRGPAASMIAIKHLGTNGGGFFGANSAHPFENPDYFTNILEMFAQMLIPFAMVFALGFYIKRKKLSRIIFIIMTLGFLCLVVPTIAFEMKDNPVFTHLGIDQHAGNMEGKEVRFGAAATAFWSIATTVISTGSVNGMHDSFTPLSGMMQMFAMMINAFYGGCGVGILNYFIFIIIAAFISGLMVGRTPEFLGRKIETREMKLAVLVALLGPFFILAGTAIAAYLFRIDPAGKSAWLNNPSFHGFSEMLYQYTSSFANNGSGFEGLGDNTPFWNITTGFVMLIGRFIPIIAPVVLAGYMAQKKVIPPSAGTLRTDSMTFGVMTLAVIIVVAALDYLPALALGPIAEFLSFR
ncbi:MAG: potassium-transporting ATPase subunit KdpA [Bacteroidetes bacterium]|nr:potassium-transporting ATPase subunit KdpA [Bacteroidota bacterium]